MDTYEQFTWKSDGKIFKGVGIYHLTFSIPGKIHLFGEVCGASKEEIAQKVATIPGVHDITNELYVSGVKNLARVDKTPFGKAVERDIANFESRHPGVKVCQYKVMDSHLHAVLWVYEHQKKSILEMAQGFRTGITKIAREMGVWPVPQEVWDEVVAKERERIERRKRMGDGDGAPHAPADTDGHTPADGHEPSATDGLTAADIIGHVPAVMDGQGSVGIEGACGAQECTLPPVPPYHVVEKPFVRTLSRSGQKRMMIDYVILNAYRKWIRHLYPELFTMHKGTVVAGLQFRSMGNHWLLDWPMRQMVECSRYATPEQVEEQLAVVLAGAKAGAVTYMAAVNDNERTIADALREGGYPLVMHLKKGFPKPDTQEEAEFKPGGKKFDACGQGHALFLEAKPATYEDARIVEATDAALMRKAQERHKYYEPLPHDTSRWRYMAGNEMMRLLSERE